MTYIGSIIATVVCLLLIGCGTPPEHTPEPNRPFAAHSAWNSKIPARPVLDERSAAITRHLTSGDQVAADLYAFGTPVYHADADTPRYQVSCDEPWGTCGLATHPVPIPADARPSPGSDASMVVIDRLTHTVFDFWQARRTASGGWAAAWGTANPLDGDGGDNGGATGAGISTLAGLVRTGEIERGRIEHALVFTTDNACAERYRYPARQTDGESTAPDCIPEGTRVQLDPSIDVAALPDITPAERAVAQALQVYGAYCRDNGGAPMALAFQNPANSPNPYPAAGLPWDFYHLPHIPWQNLRVLRTWTGR